MKHFIYINSCVASKYFSAEKPKGRLPVSNNLLWTLFLGCGEENFALIKSSLRGRTPMQVLDSSALYYMNEHNEDFILHSNHVCCFSLVYFFRFLGLSSLDSHFNSLIYFISYDH